MKKVCLISMSLILCCLISAISIISYPKSTKILSVSAQVKDKLKVVIDPGHGGEDGGAVSVYGDKEKDINLNISLTLEQLLKQSGIETIMTRNEDMSIHSPEASTTRERKVSDIHNRLNIAQSSSDNILVSIHQNHFPESKYKGAQIFYSVNNQNSINLAECIREPIVRIIQKENDRKSKEASGVYLMEHVDIPAVIVECGFLSNPDEAYLLSQEAYCNDIAYCVYLGILEYLYSVY